MNQNSQKKALWYGDGIEAWYNRPLEEAPTASIDTKWGQATIKVLGEYKLGVRVVDVISLHRVDYDGLFYFEIRLSDESYSLSNCSRRISKIKPNGERVLAGGYQYEQVTPAARKAMNDELRPKLIEWAENNGATILKGYNLDTRNKIAAARHRLHYAEEQIAKRHQWLDMLLEEMEARGNLDDEDKRRLDDIWGSQWKF
jgi:hypothetical protein